MWIMTTFGIIMPAQRTASTIEPGDNRKLQVRARDREALVELRKYMGSELGRIIATPKQDYNFRAYCTHEAFATAMARMIRGIDYRKFKPEAKTDDLHELYLDIWFAVYDHYDDSPRPKVWRKVSKTRR